MTARVGLRRLLLTLFATAVLVAGLAERSSSTIAGDGTGGATAPDPCPSTGPSVYCSNKDGLHDCFANKCWAQYYGYTRQCKVVTGACEPI